MIEIKNGNDLYDLYHILLQENKQLKIRLSREWKINEYKSKRINRVMEYIIENYCNDDGTIWHTGFNFIFNILKGSDFDDRN